MLWSGGKGNSGHLRGAGWDVMLGRKARVRQWWSSWPISGRLGEVSLVCVWGWIYVSGSINYLYYPKQMPKYFFSNYPRLIFNRQMYAVNWKTAKWPLALIFLSSLSALIPEVPRLMRIIALGKALCVQKAPWECKEVTSSDTHRYPGKACLSYCLAFN